MVSLDEIRCYIDVILTGATGDDTVYNLPYFSWTEALYKKYERGFTYMENRLRKLGERFYSSEKKSYWLSWHTSLWSEDEVYVSDTIFKAIENGMFAKDFIDDSLNRYLHEDMGIANKPYKKGIQDFYEVLEDIKETIGVKKVGCYLVPPSGEKIISPLSACFDYIVYISHMPGRNNFLSNEYQPPCYLMWTLLDILDGEIFQYIATWYPFGKDIVQMDNRVVDEISDWGLSTLVKIHQRSCKWVYGKPVEAFFVKSAYGNKKYVVCYSSGNWWYYTTPRWNVSHDKS